MPTARHGLPRTAFRLSKLYLDCVGESGECAIAYRARFRLGAFTPGYASLLHRHPDGDVHSESTLRPGPTPTDDPGQVAWRTPALNLSLEAHSFTAPFSHLLLDGPAGTIAWKCLAPSAHVIVRQGHNFTLRGLGYAERLDVALRSWHPPIERLRWGRFLTPERAIVWIEWFGPEPRTLIFDGGVPQADGVISDDEIRFAGCRLALQTPAVLRDADLSEILVALRGLGSLPVAHLGGIHETKWLSRGTLRGPASGSRVQGWAIHERVHFQ